MSRASELARSLRSLLFVAATLGYRPSQPDEESSQTPVGTRQELPPVLAGKPLSIWLRLRRRGVALGVPDIRGELG